MAGLPPGIRPWSGNGRGPPGAPPGGVPPRTLPGLEGPRSRRKKRAQSANPPMKHTGPRQVEQDLPAKMALARTVSDLDRKLQRTSAEMQEKENSLVAKTGQVDSLSQTVEFQQIKLNSLDLSLKLKEKQVSTLSDQLRKQERLIRRLQRKNEKLTGKVGDVEDASSESGSIEGSEAGEGSVQEQVDERQLQQATMREFDQQVEGQPEPARDVDAAKVAAEAADAAFYRSTALAKMPLSSESLGRTPSLNGVLPEAPGSLLQGDHQSDNIRTGGHSSTVLNNDGDGTEWFPITAMCAEKSEVSTREPIPLDINTCSLGQAVRILDAVSLRAAIENHSVDGETTFEWAPEDAQWAGCTGVLVQVNSHGFARVDFSSSRPQGNETTASFPEGIESPGMTPGNTMDAAAFHTTTSSMSSLPTIQLNETFVHMPANGVEATGGMIGGPQKAEALLPVPMFHSSMPTLPALSARSTSLSDPDGMDAAAEHDARRSMAASAGPLGQDSSRHPFMDGHPRLPDKPRVVHSPDIEPAPLLPPVGVHEAARSSDTEEDVDAGEWFPVGALTFTADQSPSDLENPPLLKLEEVRKGMLVRVSGVTDLRRAIEGHRIDGQQAFEWKDEDAKWAGLVGMVLEVDSGGVVRVDTSHHKIDLGIDENEDGAAVGVVGEEGGQEGVETGSARTQKQAMHDQLTAESQQLHARLQRQQEQRREQEEIDLQREKRNTELQQMRFRQYNDDGTNYASQQQHYVEQEHQPLPQPPLPQMAAPQLHFPPVASPNRRFMQTMPSLLTVAEEAGDDPVDSESVSSYQPAEGDDAGEDAGHERAPSPRIRRGILKAGRSDDRTVPYSRRVRGTGGDNDNENGYDDDNEEENDHDEDHYADQARLKGRGRGFDNPFDGNRYRHGDLKHAADGHESGASSMMFRTSSSLYEVDAEITEEEMWDLHVDVATGERFHIHRMTKEVRYHDDESEEDSESITKQKRVNERQTKKSKKKRSRPTGKGPRERERERERARERARSISGPPKSHRAKKNGRKTLARGMPRLAQQRHRGNGIPSSGSVRRRPGAKDTRTRKTVSSPERPRRQSPNKSRFDGSRKTAKERTRWQRYEPGDHDDHVKHQDRNGRQGQQRDNDHNRRRSQEQGQRRQRSTSRQRTGRRMERPR